MRFIVALSCITSLVLVATAANAQAPFIAGASPSGTDVLLSPSYSVSFTSAHPSISGGSGEFTVFDLDNSLEVFSVGYNAFTVFNIGGPSYQLNLDPATTLLPNTHYQIQISSDLISTPFGDSNSYTEDFTTIPEPNSAVVACLGALLLLRRRRA